MGVSNPGKFREGGDRGQKGDEEKKAFGITIWKLKLATEGDAQRGNGHREGRFLYVWLVLVSQTECGRL